MKIKNLKLIIFDVDGVLINSKQNMKLAFKKMCKKNKIQNLIFDNYFKKIGIPFSKIMMSLGVKNNIERLKKDYFNFSLDLRKKIKPYEGVYKTLKILQKNYCIAIVTSKSKKNAKNFLNFFFPSINFKVICSPNKTLKPKPYPHMLLYVCKKLRIQPSNSIYVGDTFFDYKASKGSKMKFVLAQYGYLPNDKRIKTNYKLKKFSDIMELTND